MSTVIFENNLNTVKFTKMSNLYQLYLKNIVPSQEKYDRFQCTILSFPETLRQASATTLDSKVNCAGHHNV